MVGRNGFWYTDMGSSPGSASNEFWDLEQAMESAELLCFFTVPSGYSYSLPSPASQGCFEDHKK